MMRDGERVRGGPCLTGQSLKELTVDVFNVEALKIDF